MAQKNQSISPTSSSKLKENSTGTTEVILDPNSETDYNTILNLDNDYEEIKLSEPPLNFTSNLHSYQKQALTWMLAREGCNDKMYTKLTEKVRLLHPLWEEYLLIDNTHLYFNPYTGQLSVELPKASPDCLGGLLADEMGLGKTVMMISLIHSNRIENKHSIMSQVQKKIKNTSHKTSNHHNQDPLRMMQKSMKLGGTLIIVPVTLLSQWESEFESHSKKDSLSVFIYYGTNRAAAKSDLGKYDIVLTTYGIVSSEFSSSNDVLKELYAYDWFRLVLDEAHYIKGRTIQMAKAVYGLNGKHKWCMTGTPIQNKLDDLFSLIHFLKLEPWSDYIWWNTYINKPHEKNDPVVYQILQTILKPVLLRRTKKTQNSKGELIIELPEKVSKIEYVTLSKEEKDIYDSLFCKTKTEFDKFVAEGTVISHYAHIFSLILRLRQVCDHPFLIFRSTDVVNKKDMEVAIKKFLDVNQEDLYDKEPAGTGLFMGLNGAGAVHNGHNSSINPNAPRLPRTTNVTHDYYEPIINENSNEEIITIKKPAKIKESFINETIDRLKNNDLGNCPVCLSDVEDAVITICSHVMCRYCLQKAIEAQSMCPICRTILTKKDSMTIPR